jgi:hypothetical protein
MKKPPKKRSPRRFFMDGNSDFHNLVIIHDDGTIRSHKITNAELQTINSIEDLKTFIKSKQEDLNIYSVVDSDDNDINFFFSKLKKEFMIKAQKPQKIMFHVKN